MGNFRDTVRAWHENRKRENRLRRFLRRDLADLALFGPTSMEEVCQRLSVRRQKPIHRHPYPLEVPGPFGLWLSTPSADYILYQTETTEDHQEHIKAHEVGHMLAEHESDDADDTVWQEIMPDIPPHMIRRALRRSHYDSEHEADAECVADLLLTESITGHHPAASTMRAQRAQRALSSEKDWL